MLKILRVCVSIIRLEYQLPEKYFTCNIKQNVTFLLHHMLPRNITVNVRDPSKKLLLQLGIFYNTKRHEILKLHVFSSLFLSLKHTQIHICVCTTPKSYLIYIFISV